MRAPSGPRVSSRRRVFVASIRAQISPASVGLGTLVMVGVVLDRSTPESFAEFEKAVARVQRAAP